MKEKGLDAHFDALPSDVCVCLFPFYCHFAACYWVCVCGWVVIAGDEKVGVGVACCGADSCPLK